MFSVMSHRLLVLAAELFDCYAAAKSGSCVTAEAVTKPPSCSMPDRQASCSVLLTTTTAAKVQPATFTAKHCAAEEAVVLLAGPAGDVIVVVHALIDLSTARTWRPAAIALSPRRPQERLPTTHVPARCISIPS